MSFLMLQFLICKRRKIYLVALYYRILCKSLCACLKLDNAQYKLTIVVIVD